jgi:hypothetical protein
VGVLRIFVPHRERRKADSSRSHTTSGVTMLYMHGSTVDGMSHQALCWHRSRKECGSELREAPSNVSRSEGHSESTFQNGQGKDLRSQYLLGLCPSVRRSTG